MDFVWDESKNAKNQKKHHLSFDDARNVFGDPLAITRIDRHAGELRWQIIGHWCGGIIILVVYTVREADGSDSLRIISARKATKAERRHYEKGQWV